MKAQYIKINKYGDTGYYSDPAMTILHREDGPAVEYANRYKVWYIDGKSYSEEEFNKMVNKPDYDGKIVKIDGVKYKLEKL